MSYGDPGSTDGVWEFTEAVWRALIAAFKPDNIKVFDHSANPEAKPFIALTDVVSRPWGGKDEGGSEIDMDIEATSTYRGKKQIIDITSKIRATLHDQTPYVEGWRIVLLQQEDARTIRESDGITRRAILSYRALIEPHSLAEL